MKRPNMKLLDVISGLKTLRAWHWNETQLDEGETENAICNLLDEAVWNLEGFHKDIYERMNVCDENGFPIPYETFHCVRDKNNQPIIYKGE